MAPSLERLWRPERIAVHMTNSGSFDRAKDFIAKKHRLLIDGEWKDPIASGTIQSVDPFTGEPLCNIAAADANDVDLAVQSARRAFDHGEWLDRKPVERRDLLNSIADKMMDHIEELAYLEAWDAGKSFKKVAKIEAPGAAGAFRYYAGWCDKIHGTTHDISAPGNHLAFTQREPTGVAAQIVPWNFPLGLTAMKLAPALAAGCVCILKPAEETSLSALRLGELVMEAGLPPGVLNILTGEGAVTGAALVSHAQVDKVAFTGSTAVGRSIIKAAAGNFKRVSLELGGKSPNIICADADLEHAVVSSVFGAFFNCGQNCVALSRMIVHEDVYDEVVERVRDEAEKLRMGGWDDETADMGPLISARQRERVLDYVKIGKEEGARIITGGESLDRPGYFMAPTVFADCTPCMRIVREEIFGPVLTIEKFEDADAVIRSVNECDYGLFGAVWTRDIALAQKYIRSLRIGKIVVNTGAAGDRDLPLGGFRQSGWGRELGYEGLALYLETKSVVVSED